MATICIKLHKTGQIAKAELKVAEQDRSDHLTIVITTEITGYACQRIKGETSDINSEYETIAVPTYKMELQKKGKVIATYNVTRDAWFSRGIIGGYSWKINDNDIELVNLWFEPANANVNLYYLIPLPYQGAEAYALRQRDLKGKLEDYQLKAEPHEIKMQQDPKGNKFNEARKNPDIAEGVMLHMGGWYNNGDEDRLGASLGCFGFVPEKQVKTKSEIEGICKTKEYKKFELGNEDYKKFIQKIVKESDGKKIFLLIKKRTNIQKYKILHNQ